MGKRPTYQGGSTIIRASPVGQRDPDYDLDRIKLPDPHLRVGVRPKGAGPEWDEKERRILPNAIKRAAENHIKKRAEKLALEEQLRKTRLKKKTPKISLKQQKARARKARKIAKAERIASKQRSPKK